MATFLKALGVGLAGAAALALGGCYDDGYGYSGVSVGVGTGYYGGGYGGYGGYDPYYDGVYGGGYPAYGWFDGFYYPGNGYYVYDRGGRRFRMRDRDRQHWNGGRNGQAGNWHGRGGAGTPGTPGTGNGRWDGRRRDGQWQGDGRANGPRDGEWRGNGRGRGGDARGPGQVGANPTGQQPSAEQRQRWTERRQNIRQGQAVAPGAAPGASPQRFERQRSFAPRAGNPGGGQFRQRGAGRNQQP